MEDNIITLATLTYERAQVVKSLLESEGIDCFFVITSYSIHYTKLYDPSVQKIVKDCFVVAFENGKRISLQEARQKTQE